MSCAAAADPPAISLLRYSADVGGNFVDAGTYAARNDIVADDLAGTRTRVTLAGLPATVNLRDFHVETDNTILLALDAGVTLSGTYFRPADVIRFSGSSYTKAFDATAAGVPAGVRCDGIARWGDTGKLLLSFDRPFTAAGLTILPADVVIWDDGAFGPKLIDANALGIAPTLNIDAVDTFRTKRYVLVAFDSGGTIGGVTSRTSDVLQVDLTTAAWSLRYAPTSVSDRWQHARLDGLAARNIETIFQNDLEQE